MNESAPDLGGLPPELPFVPELNMLFTPKGDKGDQGERGPKGDKGESSVNDTATAAVATLVKAAHWHRVLIILLIVLSVAVSLAVSRLAYLSVTHPVSTQIKAEQAREQAQVIKNQKEIAGLRQYVKETAQHSCAALELLTKTPVDKPADPKANPSRQATYQFYAALESWKLLDNC